jgi:hypothetical protein
MILCIFTPIPSETLLIYSLRYPSSTRVPSFTLIPFSLRVPTFICQINRKIRPLTKKFGRKPPVFIKG